jgi:hypothetical protein
MGEPSLSGSAWASRSGAGARPASSTQSRPPDLTAVAIQADSLNTLAGVVTFQAHRTDSARAICSADGAPVTATRYARLAGGSARIVVFGLLPGTRYQCKIAALGTGGATTSDSMAYQTADLPALLASVRLAIIGAPRDTF